MLNKDIKKYSLMNNVFRNNYPKYPRLQETRILNIWIASYLCKFKEKRKKSINGIIKKAL